MNFRTKAWITTGILFSVLLLWAVWAFHDAFVADYRAAKQANAGTKSKSNSGGCPFSRNKQEMTTSAAAAAANRAGGKSCCHGGRNSNDSDADDNGNVLEANHSVTIELDDNGLEILEKFNDEQLRKCPHYETYIAPHMESIQQKRRGLQEAGKLSGESTFKRVKPGMKH